jgi:hypothetical protein
VRAVLVTAVLVVAVAGCGGASRPAVRHTRTLVSPGGVTPVAVPRPEGDTPPLPAWRGPVPRAGGDEARGAGGRAWLARSRDADGDVVVRLWFVAPGGRRRLLDRSGGVMEGGSEPVSPLWVGPTLVWAVATDHNGTDFDSTIVRRDPRTGQRSRVSVPNAYIVSLARAGNRLAVRYVPTDETGDAIGPDPSHARTGTFALHELGR